MKMRKIISLFAAVTMATSAFAAFAVSASAEVAPKMEFTCEKVTDFTGLEDYDWSSYDQDTYLVSVKATGLELNGALTGKSNVFGGTSVIGATVQCNITAEGDKGDAWELAFINPLATPLLNNAEYPLSTFSIVQTDPVYPTKADLTAAGIKTLTATETPNLVQIVVCVTPGQPVTLDFQNCAINYGVFESNSIKSQDSYKTATGTLALAPAQVVVGGTTEKVVPTVTAGTVDRTDNFAGNSEFPYNAGVKGEFVVTDADKEVTAVTFNFTDSLSNVGSHKVTLPTAIASGTAAVALNITRVPAGVTLTCTSVVAE